MPLPTPRPRRHRPRVRRAAALLTLALLISGVPAAGAADAEPPVLFPRQAAATTFRPTSAIQADVDGDGARDVLVTVGSDQAGAEGTRGIGVMRSRPGGRLGPAVLVPSGGVLLDDLVAADLDGNGTVDLLATSEGQSLPTRIFPGLGDGTFGAPQPLALQLSGDPHPVRVAGEALPWLASVEDDGVVVHRNDGSMQFSPARTLPSANATAMTVLDADGDGIDAIAVATGTEVALYEGPSQPPLRTTTVSRAVSRLQALDTTGDGHPELVAIGGGVATVLGADLTPVEVRTVRGTAPLAAGDVDSDGLPDLIHPQPPTMAAVHLTSTGSTVHVPLSAQATTAFAQDATGDGHIDILAVETGASIVEVVEGDGAGSFPELRPIAPIVPGMIEFADVNGDGHVDVVSADYVAAAFGFATARVYLGAGNGSFRLSATLTTDGSPSAVVVGDVDGDANPDIVLSDYETGAVQQFLGNGDGTFGPRVLLPNCGFAEHATGGDFNDDGITDLAVVCRIAIYKDHVAIMLGSPAGLVKTPQVVPIPTYQSYSISTGDLNGDGITDLLIGAVSEVKVDPACPTDPYCALSSRWDVLSWVIGMGDGVFDPTEHTLHLNTFFQRPRLADVTGDGLDDILVAEVFQDTLLVAAGQPDGTAADPVEIPTHDYPEHIAVGDLDADGRNDVVLSHGPNMISVMHGRDDGTLAEPVGYAGRGRLSSPRIADVDGDGRLDVVVLQPGGLELFLQRA